ncbi:hypothetical protein [Microviridae sp.]|nr:hypothetical protein [Microviridae sp.]
MIKIVRNWSYKHGPNNMERKSSSPSLTIPNETYTIRELLAKHTRGIAPNIARQGHWQDDASFDSPDFNKLNGLDIVDKHQISINNQLDIDSIIKEEEEKKAAIEAEKKKAQESAAIDERPPTPPPNNASQQPSKTN